MHSRANTRSSLQDPQGPRKWLFWTTAQATFLERAGRDAAGLTAAEQPTIWQPVHYVSDFLGELGTVVAIVLAVAITLGWIALAGWILRRAVRRWRTCSWPRITIEALALAAAVFVLWAGSQIAP